MILELLQTTCLVTLAMTPPRQGRAGGGTGHINCFARGQRTRAADTNFLRIKGGEAETRGRRGSREAGRELEGEVARKRQRKAKGASRRAPETGKRRLYEDDMT